MARPAADWMDVDLDVTPVDLTADVTEVIPFRFAFPRLRRWLAGVGIFAAVVALAIGAAVVGALYYRFSAAVEAHRPGFSPSVSP